MNYLTMILVEMSASWNKSVCNPPNLPPELWLKIFEFATCVPGALEPEIYKISDLPFEEVIHDQQRQLRHSLVTKRYLVRVSKKWFMIATPYLYETVIIGRQRTLIALRDTLVRSKLEDDDLPNCARPLGWYTKRLDFLARDPEDLHLGFLVEILHCFPNLAIVNFNPRHPSLASRVMPTCIVEALCRCGPTLRLLNFSGCILRHPRRNWKMLLASTPNLRALHTSTQLNEEAPHTISDLPHLPALASLTLTGRPYVRNPIQPNLFAMIRHLELHHIMPTGLNASNTNCHHIEVLHMPFCHSPTGLCHEMIAVGHLFPNVTRLIISLGGWAVLPIALNVPRGVTCLSIYCRRHQATSSEYQAFFGALATLASSTLRTVRLVDWRTVCDLQLRHAAALARGLDIIKGCSFVLEDHEGRPF